MFEGTMLFERNSLDGLLGGFFQRNYEGGKMAKGRTLASVYRIRVEHRWLEETEEMVEVKVSKTGEGASSEIKYEQKPQLQRHERTCDIMDMIANKADVCPKKLAIALNDGSLAPDPVEAAAE